MGQLKQEEPGLERVVAPSRKYAYLKCAQRWSPKERRKDGCGKYYTKDSYLSVCPECGEPLSMVVLDSPPVARTHRVIFEKCAKCAETVTAPECVGEFPQKPDYCNVCRCRECCVEISKKAKRVQRGEYSLTQWFRDTLREQGKAQAASGTGLAKSVGEVLDAVYDDEVPF
jgi:hypothetical protein